MYVHMKILLLSIKGAAKKHENLIFLTNFAQTRTRRQRIKNSTRQMFRFSMETISPESVEQELLAALTLHGFEDGIIRMFYRLILRYPYRNS